MINLTRGFGCCLRMPEFWLSSAAKYLNGSVVIPLVSHVKMIKTSINYLLKNVVKRDVEFINNGIVKIY